MNLHTAFHAVLHHRDVAGDDSRDACLAGSIHNLVHSRDIAIIDDGVHGQVGLDARFVARLGNLVQVVDGKMVGRVGAHVQLSDAEIDAVGTCLDGCCQRLARAHGSHDFKVFHVHGCKGTIK